MKRVLLVLGPLLVVAAAAVVAGLVSGSRAHAYDAGAAALEARWADAERDGMPQSAFAAWSDQLGARRTRWEYSPAWLWDSGQDQLSSLGSRTSHAYASAVADRTADARARLAALDKYLTDNSPWITVEDTADASDYHATLAAAKTPKAILMVRDQVAGTLDDLTAKVADRQASLRADIADRGGARGVLAAAARDLAVAREAALDTGKVPQLLAPPENWPPGP